MTDQAQNTTIEFDVGQGHPEHRLRDWADILGEYFYPLDLSGPDSFARGRFAVRDIVDLRVGHIASDPMFVRRTTRHVCQKAADFYFLPLPLGGRLWLDQHGRRAEIDSDSIAFVATADPYSYDQPEPGQSYTLRMSGAALRERIPDADDFAARQLSGADQAMVRIFLSFARSFCDEGARFSPDETQHLNRQILDLLALVLDGADTVTSETAVAAAHRRRVIRHIERHFRDPELTVAAIADGVGLSERYLQKLFAGREKTVSAHLRARRVAEAQRLLDGRHDTISGVAYKIGFLDPAHFSRVFRRETGMAPQDYART